MFGLWYQSDRVQSPDHFGMSIFEIVKNLLSYDRNTYTHICANGYFNPFSALRPQGVRLKNLDFAYFDIC